MKSVDDVNRLSQCPDVVFSLLQYSDTSGRMTAGTYRSYINHATHPHPKRFSSETRGEKTERNPNSH